MQDFSSFWLAVLKGSRLGLLLLAFVCPCFCCFGQVPTDLVLPSETISSGNPVFEATNSITNSGDFVVQDSASVVLAAGRSIHLEPGFHAVAGSAPFTFFAVIDPNIAQGPPGGGYNPPSIPGSYTAPDYSPECDNITSTWTETLPGPENNSVSWDLNQTGASVSGTMSFETCDGTWISGQCYGTYCGQTIYTASGVYNGNGNYSLTADNPIPATDSCGNVNAASGSDSLTLSGRACGSGTASFSISGGGGGPLLAKSRVATPLVNSANANPVQPEASSGTSSWTTYTPRFWVAYASYIPVDQIYGPYPISQCAYSPGGFGEEPFLWRLLYKGDANRYSYRTTQAILVVPDKQYAGTLYKETGATRNYGYGSPAGGLGANLSPYPTGDIYNDAYAGADEDEKDGDCYKWNAKGHATTANMQSYNVTFPGSHQAVVTLSGLGQDPLEPQFGGIRWNATITLNTNNPSNPTAQATFTHTCYPAHNVKVNGFQVLDQQPEENTSSYLFNCLTERNPWTGKSSDVTPVPSH